MIRAENIGFSTIMAVALMTVVGTITALTDASETAFAIMVAAAYVIGFGALAVRIARKHPPR